jgi:hypothetical protein
MKQSGKAMVQSSRRARAFAEVLAMIADAQHPLAPHRPFPIRDADDWLSQSATEFALRWSFMQNAQRVREKFINMHLLSLDIVCTEN